MTPEIQDVLQFVEQQAPFSDLPEAAASYFARHIDIVYVTKGNQQDWLQDGKPNLYLIRSGVIDFMSVAMSSPSRTLVCRLRISPWRRSVGGRSTVRWRSDAPVLMTVSSNRSI